MTFTAVTEALIVQANKIARGFFQAAKDGDHDSANRLYKEWREIRAAALNAIAREVDSGLL